MHPTFLAMMESLHPSLEKLLAMEPHRPGQRLKNVPRSGVYLFTEGDTHLYVGRSNCLHLRYDQHRRPKSPPNHASFANLITCGELNLPPPTYRKGDGASRRADPTFIDAFTAAKLRVSKMDFRWVEEPDQHRQALLEIYCAVALDTKYNFFKTH